MNLEDACPDLFCWTFLSRAIRGWPPPSRMKKCQKKLVRPLFSYTIIGQATLEIGQATFYKEGNHGKSSGGHSGPGYDPCTVRTNLYADSRVVRRRCYQG